MGIADDIVVCGSTPSEHDQAFCEMLKATRKHNVSLNSEKLQFKQAQVDFYGHVLTEKLEAIHNMESPSNMGELLTILGMVTYLNHFSTKLADLTLPLRELIKKHVYFSWEPHHQQALDRIKQELCTSKLISYYDPDPSTPTVLQCDASKTGIGAWLRQTDSQGNENIVAMASQSLTDTESRYSNIERECLAVTYGLEKFEYYLLSRNVTVKTDHSPLEQIFKKKTLKRLRAGCRGYFLDACDLISMSSKSWGDPSQLPTPRLKCATREQHMALRLQLRTPHHSVTSISYPPPST